MTVDDCLTSSSECVSAVPRLPYTNTSMSPYSLNRCCPQCPRESSPSGLTRHRRACKIYQQHINASLSLARYAEYKRGMNALQAKQRVVDVEEADSERIQTDTTVSFSFSFFTQIVLTCHSHLALIGQMSTCLMQSPIMIPAWHSRMSQTLLMMKVTGKATRLISSATQQLYFLETDERAMAKKSVTDDEVE